MKVGTTDGGRRQRRPLGLRIAILIPYLWLAVLLLLPFLIVFKISLSQYADKQPPYVPELDLAAGTAALKGFFAALSLDNYLTLFTDPLYYWSYVRSLEIATVSTVILLLTGYPVAYAMARAPRRLQGMLVMLIILPFFTSFLIRVYAWINILQHDGLLNQVLMALGFLHEPATWISTDTAVYIGIVYSYFPFMVLPLYATLEKQDATLGEAAADLGCPPWKAFWLVTVPLSRSGIVAGSLLCFIPIVGEYVIPDLLGSSATQMIGQTLWDEFFHNTDWPVASAIAMVLLCLLVGPIVLFQHAESRQMERVD
jgi:putrescine transport system permease protein